MTGLAAAHERRRSDSTLKRARVSQTIQLAVARGDVPTISKIAREAGVDRSIFYGERGTPLRPSWIWRSPGSAATSTGA